MYYKGNLQPSNINKVIQKLDEIELLKLLALDNSSLHSTLLPVMINPRAKLMRKDFIGAKYRLNVQRRDLGLLDDKKPGDFDIVLIPVHKGKTLIYDEAAAIEVKVVRPTNAKLKSPNSSGKEQVLGIATDGFPYVGLLHVIVAEPGELYQMIPFHASQANKFIDNRIPELMSENGMYADLLGFQAMTLQYARLKQLNLPPYIALASICFNATKNGNFIVNDPNSDNYAERNPLVKQDMVERVRKLYLNNPEAFRDFTYR